MSFPLGSLLGGEDATGEAASPTKPVRRQAPKRDVAPPSAASRLLRTPLWLALTALVLGLLLLALATHDLRDAAFTTSGGHDVVANRVGSLGAWLSDGLLFLFGFSAWWLPLLALRGWLRSLAGLLRHDPPAAPRLKRRLTTLSAMDWAWSVVSIENSGTRRIRSRFEIIAICTLQV